MTLNENSNNYSTWNGVLALPAPVRSGCRAFLCWDSGQRHHSHSQDYRGRSAGGKRSVELLKYRNKHKRKHVPETGSYFLTYMYLVSNMLNSVNQVRLGSIRKKCDSTRLPFKRYPTWTPKPISMILALNLILLIFERPLKLFFEILTPKFYPRNTVITGPLRGLNFEFQHQVAQEETFSILGTQLFPLSSWTLPSHNLWTDFYSYYVEIAIGMWLFAPWTTNLESTSILA